jgi:aminopeptidase-like protein
LNADGAREDSPPGEKMYRLIETLYPICRSITGPGVAETLGILARHIPLQIHRIASGSKVFDWTVPKEWSIRDAYVKDRTGKRVIDFKVNNLHVVSYSRPINETMSLEALKAHLHTDPAHPDWIPYRTSYYKEDWGFCLAQTTLDALSEGPYDVCIDSTLADGELIWGEFFLAGSTTDEIVISTHICHPSLANDNLSGISVCVALAEMLMKVPLRYSVRILFIPGTIGSITWLAVNQEKLASIKHGLIAVNLGDAGRLNYKRSRHETAEIDRVVEYLLKAGDHTIRDFSPYGYDERQFCSPGINLPFGCLSRTPYGEFPQYHTSADNLDFVKATALEHSLKTYADVLRTLNRNRYFINLSPMCEPQLGKRGLYEAMGGQSDTKTRQMALLWVLNYSDGKHDLLDIAVKSGLAFDLIADAAELLTRHDLLEAANSR